MQIYTLLSPWHDTPPFLVLPIFTTHVFYPFWSRTVFSSLNNAKIFMINYLMNNEIKNLVKIQKKLSTYATISTVFLSLLSLRS